MTLLDRRRALRTASLMISAVSLILFSGGCGSGSGALLPGTTATRQIPAVYTNLDGTTYPPYTRDLLGRSVVCTVNAAHVPGSPKIVKLLYTLDSLNLSGRSLTLTTAAGPGEAILRQGRYRFLVNGPGPGKTLRVFVVSSSGTVGLTPLAEPLPPLRPSDSSGGGGGGAGTGIPIFTTNLAGEIIVAAPSNTVVTLTVDATSVLGAPDVAPVTYTGPISGPAEVTKIADQYVIEAVTGTVTESTPTSIRIGTNPNAPFTSGDGPVVNAP